MTEQSDKFINTKLGGCEILEKIGSGGMGSVYKAHHLGLDKIVCIKILSADLAKDERQVQFFLREARSAARLDHPNIVQIHHVGMEHDVHFILMSFIKGETLSGLVARKGSLLITEATNIITGILNGLTAAHSNSIIHRDIKPSNILITDTGVPKIVDFGLARSLKEEKQLTITGELAGTAYFMAPEQGLGGSIDHRADLYATGATYFYILTSKYPFEGKTFMDVVHKHISQPLPSLMKIRSDIPLWTEQVIEKLMRKKPENRFQSAREVLDALSSHEHNGEMQSSSDSVREFDIPLITARLKEISQRSDVAPTAKPARMEPAEKAPPPKPEPAGQAGEVKPSAAASVISWIMSDKYLRFAVHLSITIAAGAIFLLAGSMHGMSGNAGVILLSTCGLGLLLWSFLMRHSRRQTGSTFIDISLSLCSFVLFFLAGVLERGGADAISRAWIVVTQMRAHFFTRDNTLVYAVIAFIISISIFSGYTRGWRKAAGALLAVV